MNSSPAESGGPDGLKYFTALIAFSIPVISVLTPLGLAPLLAFAAFVHVGWARWRDGIWPKPPGIAPGIIVVFAAWAAITLLWTPDGAEAVEKFVRLIVLVALGMLYFASTRSVIDDGLEKTALLAGASLAIAFLLIEKAGGAPLYRLFIGDIPIHDINLFFNRFNRGMTVICLVAWPAAHAAAKFHHLAGFGLIAVALGLSAWMNSAAALLALVLGSICYVLVWVVRDRRMLPALGGIAAAVVIFMPTAIERISVKQNETALRAALPESAFHRLLIWDFSTDRIAERPILGWGFYASRAIPGGVEKIEGDLAALPLHPHNAALQWRLELGLPGAILGGILMFVLFRRAGRFADRTDRATIAATLTSNLTIALLSYGIWQSWWIAALMFSAAAIHVRAKSAHQAPSDAG